MLCNMPRQKSKVQGMEDVCFLTWEFDVFLKTLEFEESKPKTCKALYWKGSLDPTMEGWKRIDF
jgi:hypothetical protein